MTQLVSQSLSALVAVKPRYTRSVSLERDFDCITSSEGYVITSLTRATILRIADGFRAPRGRKAWTLTGPYGSGKSAFALYLAGLLAVTGPMRSATHQHLKDEDPELWRELFDQRRATCIEPCQLFPVLVTGSREPLRRGLATGFAKALKKTDTALSLRFEAYLHLPDEQQLDRNLLELIEQANAASVQGDATGLLLVIDELGKYLEYCAQNPSSGDLQLLQHIAEMADRSPTPMLFVTLLHQAFDRYAETATALERSEWTKLQGRFEDVAFQESQEQNVRLIANAIEWLVDDESAQSWSRAARKLAAQSLALNLRPPGLTEADFETLLEDCAPLHPLVALCLGPLFRRLAQNERSLFAFLSSREPGGFQDFLQNTNPAAAESFYSVAQLYDYLAASLGSSLYGTSVGSKWAEVESSLERLGHSGTEQEIRILKAVGILNLQGVTASLKPSKDLLTYAAGLTPEDAEVALQALCHRSILVFRTFNETYAVWGGSDFDLEARLTEKKRDLVLSESLADLLTREAPIRPVVARRHSAQMGVLRYFQPLYWDANTLNPEALPLSMDQADGAIVLLIGSTEDSALAQSVVKQLRNRPEVVLGIPQTTRLLSGYLHELRALREILAQTAELAGDPVARREIRARIQDTQQAVRSQIESLLDRVTEQGHWFNAGKSLAIYDRRHLIAQLSTICDQVYSKTPIIRNELIHRRVVSSACAAARNVLIEAMLTQGETENLGIQGHPLERSLYDSLLANSGIHRQVSDVWEFGPPDPNHPDRISELWDAMDDQLAYSEVQRVSVAEVFAALRRAPYGLKDGPLPIFLCAYLLSHDGGIAVYEEGAFVPRLSLSHYERLVRTPARFELQRYSVGGIRGEVYTQLAGNASGSQTGKKHQLLTLIRPIFQLVGRLNPYAKVTRTVSNVAAEVRLRALDAKDPVKFLFEELPAALEMPAFNDQEVTGSNSAEQFVDGLKSAMNELQNAYPKLLARLESSVFAVLEAGSGGEKGRAHLAERARRLMNVPVEDHAKGVLIRLADERVDLPLWLEGIANALIGKLPKHWVDKDEGVFNTALQQFRGRFRQLEVLARQLNLISLGSDSYCLTIVTPNNEQNEKVLAVSREEQAGVKSLKKQIEKLLRSNHPVLTTDAKLAALTEVALQLLTNSEADAQQLQLDL